MNGNQPLSRFKVLDLTRVRAGPSAVRQLADWGADVIKVEMPADEDDGGYSGTRHSADFQNLHRNKRSMTLDLKATGKEILRKLIAQSDVLVENYRPDVKYWLGIDYESLRQINPRLVYASISGFGQDGPYAKRPGVDQIAQGMSGLYVGDRPPGTWSDACWRSHWRCQLWAILLDRLLDRFARAGSVRGRAMGPGVIDVRAA